jgi:cytoskeleton protein RodZ
MSPGKDVCVGSFGERLQSEREMRGVTLEEISEATKIGTRSLRALEHQDFDQLPGGIFNKGFVRAYARYLGLDEDQAVADYQTALSEAIAAGKVTRQEPSANAVNPDRALLEDLGEREPTRLPLGAIAVVVLLAVAVFGGWKYYSRHGLPKFWHPRAAARSARPSVPHAAAAVPALKPAADVSQPAATAAVEGFVVRVEAKQDSWVSITADGKPVMEGTLPAGGEKSIPAQRTVVVKAGNASAIELYHNNKPVPLQARAGEVKTLEFNAAGLRQ